MDFDAIVIGAGHAGIEASLALARLGFSTLLVTQSLDAVGRLSCNPAVGGLAKGNLVREIDALGGEMAKLIDRTQIQFRMLNKSKGPAVQAPRAQADKEQYSLLAKHTLEAEKNLALFQDTVVDFILSPAGTAVAGVITARGRRFSSRTVVLTTGTFMEARIFIGAYSAPGGRLGEPAAEGLGSSLRRLGFDVGRLKTGTPARVLRRSVHFKKMEEQSGDAIAQPFSFSHDTVDRPSLSCWITYTTPQTHEIIRDNIASSPLYSGKIVGIGPRYCPSIEDKVMRFPDRERHQIFVEPEGLATEEMYLNGISSSLPEEVQDRFLRTVPGLEDIVIARPGYAVEYDFLNPVQLSASLETKRLAGLFVAGQTNGTSGYEEAAAQGLMAGVNAARKLQGALPIVLSRAEAYIGVLIDDLVTLGTAEPYRMFTSRAEHRLSLRHDTADARLLEKGVAAGLQTREAHERFLDKSGKIDEIKELLEKRKVKPDDAARFPALDRFVARSLAYALKDPGVRLDEVLAAEPLLAAYPAPWRDTAELDIKYAGYVKKQDAEVERVRRLEKLVIPRDFDFGRLEGVSREASEKFTTIRPHSVGQATRIPGVRNADIAVLIVYLTKKRG
jgi:tRNA uridine 5-carboxymethylaminomethyl modification enzyme